MNKIIHDILNKPVEKITLDDGEIVRKRTEEIIELMHHYPVEEFQYEMELIEKLCNKVLDYADGKIDGKTSSTFSGLKLVDDSDV